MVEDESSFYLFGYRQDALEKIHELREYNAERLGRRLRVDLIPLAVYDKKTASELRMLRSFMQRVAEKKASLTTLAAEARLLLEIRKRTK